MSWLRTHTCGDLTKKDVDQEVILNGWVSSRRDLGGVIFIDLRDRYGITQIVFDESNNDLHSSAEDLRSEYVIGIKGKVLLRDKETINPAMPTGEIEIEVSELNVYSEAETPPFEIKDGIATNEETRLKYRYLDLRRPEIQQNLLLRSKLYHTIRSFYHKLNFAEVETPVLMRSTPEGARDYLVPSRVNAGKFFALPQSPQTYKQLLMVSGMDRYFQIVKCFRDEDLRADRQPEFTQVDVEMTFVDEEQIYKTHEELMAEIWKTHLGKEIKTPFPRMQYKDAIETYGSDKPDTRFGLKIKNLSDLLEDCGFKIFESTVKKGGRVVSISVPGKGDLGRGALDRLTEDVKRETGAAGLIYIKVSDEGHFCSVGKFLTEEKVEEMVKRAGAENGDLVLILAGPNPQVYKQMGILRLMMGRDLELIDQSADNFLWVTDFPLVEWDKEEKRYVSLHHPFTAPKEEDLEKLEKSPEEVNARAYDLVLNGSEIGGGSIRIHNSELQNRMFRLLGIGEEEAREKFGFLLDAFTYGAPPHGGIALGLDRVVMIMAGAGSLRDVIAFPKNQKAQSTMDKSPGEVDEKQLRELHIKLREIN
ncbi:aspartate--tRNA ligase [Rhodohalobacter sp. SW132]|uniref:aspartate--tRNA ligase n=1 Tax=Rhodohalobacter sp. SW132 TaxID=2293433 RepID=UPI000E221ECA|nr:aspartate--tRNA ligase [Rhodohalobacter sp. SW132]REL24586.1 aspartate--tRNA ligase [Rhodohalobacter sp. SW132]